MTRRVAVGLMLLAATLAVTCARPVETEPTIERQAQILVRDIAFMHDTMPLLRFDPPPVYAMWMAEVEQCSGLRRDGQPTYWIAPRAVMHNDWIGMYVRQERRAIFALGAETLAWVVRHEMLHDRLNLPGHPPEYFGDELSPGKCGHLVRRAVPQPPQEQA